MSVHWVLIVIINVIIIVLLIKTRPTDEDIFQDLYSQTLIHDDTQTPIIESGLLSPVVVSAFKTNFFEETSTPYTPQNQMTNNLNSCGFSPVDKKNVTTTISTQSSIFTLRSSSKSEVTTPRCSTDDLIEPHVSIVSEFAKHSINDNLKILIFSISIQNEVLSAHVTESSQKDNELKFKIHDKVISHITSTIRDSKGVSFSKLPYLRMFDCFDISLDGSVWEYVYAFIFDETLILMNEELDSVIGTVLLGEHYTSCYKIDNTTLVIYFSSASLPELQIHSQNKILLDKWVEFFEYKLRQKQMVPLVQMTTNTWDLIDDGSLELPSEIVKFNDLTSRGLDLPLQVMKSVMTIPKRLPCVVIACYNDTTLDDEVYSRQIKNVLRLTLDQLEQCDKFGLRQLIFGITSADWSQWDDIIDDLRVYKGSKKNMGSKMDSMIKSINKHVCFGPFWRRDRLLRSLMMIRTGGVEEGDAGFDFKTGVDERFQYPNDILYIRDL
ncbi:Cyclin-dependent kinase inhibitor FAR1 [Cyberlindnera fabianii]|uniref:Cyclin-dependent kinase inhibitor FAR1 n=1 Tax=Cyberlindnera fabianii TaxID=36022 RepID=A0A1V2LCH0_CYBFA|nr:Cyclin-dependent kinase inhibitor FAR1 [Cyberlindnera fabianii]